MRYLYFKDEKLFLNDKHARPDLVANGYTEKIVDDAMVLTVDVEGQDPRDKTKAEIESTETYVNKRRLAYPEIGDQLDDLFKAGAFSEEMTAQIQAVKDNNPK